MRSSASTSTSTTTPDDSGSSARRSGSRWAAGRSGSCCCSRSPTPSRGAVRHRRRRQPRARVGRRAVGDRQLRAADGAVPRRGALGRVRVGEPRERLPHDRPHAPPRRRPREGAARRHRRQLQRHADRLSRAARVPPRAARPRVRPRPPARDEPLRAAARADRAVPLDDELQRPLLPRLARRRRRGGPLLRRRPGRVGDGAPADGVPHGLAGVRVLDPRRGGGATDVRLRAHVPDGRHGLGGARADAPLPVARRPPRGRPVRGVVARRRPARVLDGVVRGVRRRRDRRRSRADGRSSTGS